MDLYSEYMSSLSDEDLKSESEFTFLSNLGLNFFIHMSQARLIAKDILDGNNPVSYASFLKIQKIRDLLMESKQRYELLKENTDLPYEDASRYIDCMLEECNLLTKLHLAKPVSYEEVCNHIDYRDSTDEENYNKLFLPEISPEDRQLMIEFQKYSPERENLLYAQLLVYYALGF